jgi:AraC-like DNA-binding protein
VLAATSMRQYAGGTLSSVVFLERRFRVHLVTRDRLLYDSAYAPPARRETGSVHLYANLRGVFHASGQPPRDDRHAYLLAETEFDRVQPGSPTFRSYGAPTTVVELRLLTTDVLSPIGLGRGPLALPERVWDAYATLQADASEAAVRRLIDELCAARVLAPKVAASVMAVEPERFARVWEVMRPLYQDLATSTSLKQLATLANLSLRQLGRDLNELARTFGVFGGGFRDAMRILRLRAACVLLSAPRATPSEVAREVGYGSLDAMGRAFRDAHLPAPSVVQEAVRYRDG